MSWEIETGVDAADADADADEEDLEDDDISFNRASDGLICAQNINSTTAATASRTFRNKIEQNTDCPPFTDNDGPLLRLLLLLLLMLLFRLLNFIACHLVLVGMLCN